MAETGRYLYAIGRGLTPDDLADVAGLQGGRLEVVERHGLTAIVSTVNLDEFGEEGLRRNLEDLAWLEQVARTHDTVVHQASARTATAPLRLATVCLGDDQVRARLDEWREALERTLDRISGRMEWSVKTFAAEAAASVAGPSDPPTGAGAGAAYLKRRKEATTQREDASEAAARLADEIHMLLCGFAVAGRRLPPQDRRLTGHEGTMTLNGAYLVETTSAEKFRTAAKALGEEHPEVRFDVQGPWPPYSFATLDDA